MDKYYYIIIINKNKKSKYSSGQRNVILLEMNESKGKNLFYFMIDCLVLLFNLFMLINLYKKM